MPLLRAIWEKHPITLSLSYLIGPLFSHSFSLFSLFSLSPSSSSLSFFPSCCPTEFVIAVHWRATRLDPEERVDVETALPWSSSAVVQGNAKKRACGPWGRRNFPATFQGSDIRIFVIPVLNDSFRAHFSHHTQIHHWKLPKKNFSFVVQSKTVNPSRPISDYLRGNGPKFLIQAKYASHWYIICLGSVTFLKSCFSILNCQLIFISFYV